MGKEIRAALLACAAVIAIMAIVPPSLFGRQPPADIKQLGDHWSTFVFNYQTLISGILAVCAAALTVFYLSRQITEASQHHRDNMKVQFARSRALAKTVIREASLLLEVLSASRETWVDNRDHVAQVNSQDAANDYRVFLQLLPAALFRRIEDEIDVPEKFQVDLVRDRMTDWLDKNGSAITMIPSGVISNQVLITIRMLDQYLTDARSIASRHIGETNRFFSG